MSFSFRQLFVGTSIALVGACQAPTPLYSPNAPPKIKEACTLTERRCTECHDHDRIIDAHLNAGEWATLVERMRQMPGSTIRPDETDIILRCLLATDTQ